MAKSKYELVKAWRLRNPEYHRNWMRKFRGSKLADKKRKVDDLSDLIPKK